MFYFFIFDLACVTAADIKYRGFNDITIQVLDVHEIYSGWFAERKKQVMPRVKNEATSQTG